MWWKGDDITNKKRKSFKQVFFVLSWSICSSPMPQSSPPSPTRYGRPWAEEMMGFAKRKPSGNHVPMVRIQIGSFARRFHGVPFGKLMKLMGKRCRFMRKKRNCTYDSWLQRITIHVLHAKKQETIDCWTFTYHLLSWYNSHAAIPRVVYSPMYQDKW